MSEAPAAAADGDGFDVRSLALSLRAGTRLGRHVHAWGQLVFANAGVMQVSNDAATWLVPPTKAIWLPAGTPHRIAARSELALRTLYVAPVRAAPLARGPATLEVRPLLRELILYILDLGMLAPARPTHDRLAGLLVDLLQAAPAQDLSLPLPMDRRALQLAERVMESPGEARDLALLAEDVGASLRTLQRVFPRETGLTIEAWRKKARLIHAVGLLAAGARVTDAALESGYQSVGTFVVAFQRQFDVTPGRYFSRR